MGLPTNDSILAPGQKLIETWEIEFEGKEQRHKKPYRFVTARLRHWFHGTYYGGSGGEGETISEARLAMVLGTARAICDDETAFRYDAEEIHKAQTLAWFAGKIKELDDELECELEDAPRKTQVAKIKRRIKFVNWLCAEWQEEHDYWPEDEDAPGSQTTREADRRTAVRAVLRDRAAEARANPGGGGEG